MLFTNFKKSRQRKKKKLSKERRGGGDYDEGLNERDHLDEIVVEDAIQIGVGVSE